MTSTSMRIGCDEDVRVVTHFELFGREFTVVSLTEVNGSGYRPFVN